ncbi:Holliday junction resolvase RuvX [bacterium]|nr:MAG: Holliday junction resolvase RuvX [bacterium]
MGRWIGVDYGEKRVGIAMTDELGKIPMPYKTVDKKDAMKVLQELVREYEIEGIVVGYPVSMKGERGKSARKVEEFVGKVKKLGVRVELWDERLTTVEAERIMRELGRKPSREKEKVDMVAASLILESFLRKNEG